MCGAAWGGALILQDGDKGAVSISNFMSHVYSDNTLTVFSVREYANNGPPEVAITFGQELVYTEPSALKQVTAGHAMVRVTSARNS
jgi:hypothetical protein